jgi:hypothetical protein
MVTSATRSKAERIRKNEMSVVCSLVSTNIGRIWTPARFHRELIVFGGKLLSSIAPPYRALTTSGASYNFRLFSTATFIRFNPGACH